MKRLLPILLVLISSLIACKSTKRAYEQGDYETAILNSVKRLQNSPNNKKSRETLAKAYPDLVHFIQGEINHALQSPNPLRWEEVADYYSILNKVYDAIQRSPAAREVIPSAIRYSQEYGDATLKAAESRYALGEQRLALGKQGDREAAKQAYDHFQRAMRWRAGYRDAEAKMFEAQDLATLFVQIEPIPMHSRTLELTNEFFENQIAEYINATTFNPFIRFYMPSQASQRARSADHLVRMQFDDFVVGQSYVKETVMDRTKDSVVVGTVKITEDSSVNAYGTVKAKVHRFQKEISSSGLLDLKIIDQKTGRVISQRKFPGTFVWYDYWGFYNGDERALDAADDRYLRKSKESPNPLPQDLFIEFTKPIYNQLTRYVSDFYQSY